MQTKTTPLKRFAEIHNLKTAVAKAIIRSADKVAKAGEDYSNGEGPGVERRYLAAQREFSALIKANGFHDYEMPSLYPVLIKDGEMIHLPD